MARDVGVVIPAAGEGRRFGGERPKALVRLAGSPLLLHSLRIFARHADVAAIVVVTRAEDQAAVAGVLDEQGPAGRVQTVVGGPSRAESVARGIAALPAQARWVLVHDAARPCVDDALVERVIAEVRQHDAVASGLPAAATVKAVDREHGVRLTLDRESLWLAQTPQAFRRDWLADALARAQGQLEQMPDDAAVCEWAGYPVRMVAGDPLNIKVTVPADLVIAEAILTSRQQGIGTHFNTSAARGLGLRARGQAKLIQRGASGWPRAHSPEPRAKEGFETGSDRSDVRSGNVDDQESERANRPRRGRALRTVSR
ncbi:MAG: 2-C-methyl-D-erythritol 4-phosphate cytidylyltransferase [Candidatus Omnitrophica bacterium]|nr:2-C-methyl-D-erythritol 4-phosphate cytidylyltransferase [Candidatus Omnitrophota bacterium]